MAKKLTGPLRSALIDYRDTPKTGDGELISQGAARRITQYGDKLRYGRIASRNRSAELDYPPALSPYGGKERNRTLTRPGAATHGRRAGNLYAASREMATQAAP